MNYYWGKGVCFCQYIYDLIRSMVYLLQCSYYGLKHIFYDIEDITFCIYLCLRYIFYFLEFVIWFVYYNWCAIYISLRASIHILVGLYYCMMYLSNNSYQLLCVYIPLLCFLYVVLSTSLNS